MAQGGLPVKEGSLSPPQPPLQTRCAPALSSGLTAQDPGLVSKASSPRCFSTGC